jgi:hypothetical protein
VNRRLSHFFSEAPRRKDPTILTVFEETTCYHGQVSARAHKTRRKNAEQAQTEDAPVEAPVGQVKDNRPAVLPQ